MEQRIEIDRLEQAVNIFGSFDENIRLIEAEFHVVVTNREGELRIAGEPEDTMLASKAIIEMRPSASRRCATSSAWPAPVRPTRPPS